ncbi:MAG: cysteine peptidase family C39 domain-containing protein [Planctomycetota bacterium]
MYRADGIDCQVQTFDDPAELIGQCPVIVIVKYRPMVDHYVTVLEATDETILIGDPLKGKETLTHDEFMDKWRQIGIIVSKTTVADGGNFTTECTE